MSGNDRGLAIECRGLAKRYGDVLALDGLDLEVPAGSVFGFLGPNGAGKTTTLRILASLGRADAGEARVGGVPVGGGAPNRAGLIGYLDQDPRFYGWMTPRDLLRLVGRLHGMDGPGLSERIDASLATAGLADAARRTIGGFSGGMRQRLGLAQAILNRPPVLLLDEPVSSLDPQGRHDMLQTIRDLGREATVLFSTHILNDVERVCDRVAIIDHGRVVTASPMDELLGRYATPTYVIETMPADDATLESVAQALRAVPGVGAVEVAHGTLRATLEEDEAAARELLARLAAQDVTVVAFERQRPSLEDVFLRVVGHEGHGAAA
ncbi:MAG TPA: ABC transporter ATP-binding protein [Candidatus Limnocylindria bacterium]|nr:ABC transporter ATP-binding protein [Candidatus Limnocylindria bacterium]